MPVALLSVSDKRGVLEFAQALAELGWDLVSTGGTARSLRAGGLNVRDVTDVTGLPEMLNGRVKTLHPAVHAGILADRRNEEHMSAIASQNFGPIDLVAVNLYPFEATSVREGATSDEVIENIDIGGPAMLRSAAKNFHSVTVVVDPDDYARVLGALKADDDDLDLRRLLAEKAFAHTAGYDAAISRWFSCERSEIFPERLVIALNRRRLLRYGENPGQKAALYTDGTGTGIGNLVQKGGKELSFNNLLDLEGALLATDPFLEQTCCAIVKHTSPCGIAIGDTPLQAYRKALACDPVSAFGSIISLNGAVDAETAEAISSLFVECLVAPQFSSEALEILGRKQNLRVLEGTAQWKADGVDHKRIRGGFLVQQRAKPVNDSPDWTVVTRRAPTDEERRDLAFAWRAVGSVKSNAIVLVRDQATIGIGAGQMSRVDASFVAVHKARTVGHETAGAVLGSDAFFPFRDGVEQAAEAGITAIVQPGGSVRDAEVIAAADEHEIAMVFTGQRQFRH